ncbi:MAG: hypothetical protein OEY99_05390 [Aigarchaeota archaeon]|nr:hypothetical protein [Aigarchaeota archaeon]
MRGLGLGRIPEMQVLPELLCLGEMQDVWASEDGVLPQGWERAGVH